MRISDWSSDVCSSDLAEHDGRCAICVVLVAIAGLSADTDTDAAPACAECDRCIQCGCCKSLHVAGRDARCRVLSPGWCARQHQCARNQNCLIFCLHTMIPLWLARTAHVMILALPRNTLLAHLYKHKVLQAITAGILFSAPSFSRGGIDLFFGACGLRAATHLRSEEHTSELQ